MDIPPAAAPSAPTVLPLAGTERAAVVAPGSLRVRWQALVTTVLGCRAAVAPGWLRLEKWSIVAVIVLSAVVQFNAVLHDGAMGQDYPVLFKKSVILASNPTAFAALGGQDPPVFFYANAFFVWLTGNIHAEAVCGLFNLFINLGALWAFYRLERRFIAGGVWRVALFTLVAFLPLRLIHAVVLSSDALTLWPFFALAGIAAALTDADSTAPRRLRLALGAGGLLTLGVLIKYTFMSALLAVFLVVLQMARRRLVPWREAALLWAAVLVLPLLVVFAQQRLHPDFSGAMAIAWRPTGIMTWRDVLWVHERDARIFAAPPYDQPIRVSPGHPDDPGLPYELLQPHGYSYLALTHLDTFTDTLNIFQYDPTDSYFGARTARNKHLMAAAVKSAVPVTLLCMGAVALVSLLAIATGLGNPARSRPDLEAVYLLAFGWFSNIVVFLPYVTMPYRAGFWTARLTMAGLLTFLLLTVYVLERLLPGGRVGRTASWTALVYVAGQSVLQVSFLWPWGKM